MPAPKPKAKPAPKPRFRGKSLKRKIDGRMQIIDARQKKATKLIGIGIGTAAAFDPHIGVPIGLAGIGVGLSEAMSRNSLRRKLLAHPRTAALMAQEFKGTKHQAFFSDIAIKAKKRREKKLAKWKAVPVEKGPAKRKTRLKTVLGKFRAPKGARTKLKVKK